MEKAKREEWKFSNRYLAFCFLFFVKEHTLRIVSLGSPVSAGLFFCPYFRHFEYFLDTLAFSK